MKLRIRTEWKTTDYDGIIIPVKAGAEEFSFQGIVYKKLISSGKLKDEGGSALAMTMDNADTTEIYLAVIDGKYQNSFRKLLQLFGDAVRSMLDKKAKKIGVVITEFEKSEIIKAAAEAAVMAEYKFDDFKSSDDEKTESTVDILVKYNKYDSLVKEAETLALMNLRARELVNLPANLLNPTTLAGHVLELGRKNGFEVDVSGSESIKDLGMESFLSVSRASEEEPRLIVMRYNGNPGSEDRIGFVGKGLTYDSGGLSIKSTKGMVDMKGDMAGAAGVIGAISTIAAMKLKVNATAVVAACENMISGKSYRPGDIIKSMGGKSIFVGNTDAEGRLTLIDAMHYIVTRENVTCVLDMATLTGAAIKCGGNASSVAIGNDDEFYEKAEKAFFESGEQILRMPVFDEYRELIKHDHADLTNIAGDPGTVTAGLFVGAFNGDIPWIHVDIAGTFITTKEKGIYSKGATGEGVRPLYELAKAMQ